MFELHITEGKIDNSRKMFEKFVATKKDYGDLTVIDWRNKDGSSNWEIRYILDGDKVIITGDLGYAIFRRYGNTETLEGCSRWINQLFYISSKLQVYDHSDVYSYNEARAESNLHTLLFDHWGKYMCEDVTDDECSPKDIEARENLQSLYNELIESFNSYSGFEFTEDVYHYLNELEIETESYSLIADCGKQWGQRFIAWLVGLKMIYEQLSKGEEAKNE